MARKKKHPEHVNHERWLVSYADFITLLFAFFVVMFAVVAGGLEPRGALQRGLHEAPWAWTSGLMEGGRSLLPDGKPPPPEPPGAGGTAEGRLPKELMQLAKKLGQNSDELAGLKILQRRNELVIRLADSLLFDSGDDTLKEQAVRVVQAIANELRDRKVDVRVEGHTDDVPIRTVRYRSNWDLSTARATAVIAQLNGPGRIAATRLAASGYGEFRPVASNTTPEGRAQNRRVDLVIAASLDTPVVEVDAPSVSASASASASADAAPVMIGPPLPPSEDEEAAGSAEPSATGAHAGAGPAEHPGAGPAEHPSPTAEHPSPTAEHPGAAPAAHASAAPAAHASAAPGSARERGPGSARGRGPGSARGSASGRGPGSARSSAASSASGRGSAPERGPGSPRGSASGRGPGSASERAFGPSGPEARALGEPLVPARSRADAFGARARHAALKNNPTHCLKTRRGIAV
jgi:chemotaxis protein MotB